MKRARAEPAPTGLRNRDETGLATAVQPEGGTGLLATSHSDLQEATKRLIHRHWVFHGGHVTRIRD